LHAHLVRCVCHTLRVSRLPHLPPHLPQHVVCYTFDRARAHALRTRLHTPTVFVRLDVLYVCILPVVTHTVCYALRLRVGRYTPHTRCRTFARFRFIFRLRYSGNHGFTHHLVLTRSGSSLVCTFAHTLCYAAAHTVYRIKTTVLLPGCGHAKRASIFWFVVFATRCHVRAAHSFMLHCVSRLFATRRFYHTRGSSFTFPGWVHVVVAFVPHYTFTPARFVTFTPVRLCHSVDIFTLLLYIAAVVRTPLRSSLCFDALRLLSLYIAVGSGYLWVVRLRYIYIPGCRRFACGWVCC